MQFKSVLPSYLVLVYTNAKKTILTKQIEYDVTMYITRSVLASSKTSRMFVFFALSNPGFLDHGKLSFIFATKDFKRSSCNIRASWSPRLVIYIWKTAKNFWLGRICFYRFTSFFSFVSDLTSAGDFAMLILLN